MVDPAGGDGRRSAGRRARRPALDRERVVGAALELIDEGGVEALSMRGLGSRLGYEGMALYRYVDGREDLLEAVVHRLTDALKLPDDPGPWEDYLTDVAGQVRRMAMDHPKAFPLTATRHPAAPWVHPPLRSLRVIEHLLATLRAQGWGPEAAVEAYQAFCSFLLGFLLLEVSSQGESVVPGAGLDEGLPDDPHAGEGHDREVDVTNYPTVTELRPLLESSDITAEFRAGLDALFVRLRRLAPRA